MSIGSKIGVATSKEIQVIETYVQGLRKLLNSSTALERLRLFPPITIEYHSSSRNDYHYESKQVDEIYEYYRKQNPSLFAKQQINDYEVLRDSAINFCRKYDLINY